MHVSSRPAEGQSHFASTLTHLALSFRLHDEPARDYQEKEQYIDDLEYGLARLIEDDSLKPVLNKRTLVDTVRPRRTAEDAFPDRQWAEETQQRFDKHKSHGKKMQRPERQISHERLLPKEAYPNDRDAQNNEANKKKM